MNSKILQFIYTLFIGILLAAFVGVGIAAFYEAPKQPEYPINTVAPKTDGTLDPAYQIQMDAYSRAQTAYQTRSEDYNRNVSIIAIIAAVVILVISLTTFHAIQFMADGLLLGGLITLIYGILRGFGTPDNKYRFVAVGVGLIVSLVVGYVKFIKQHAAATDTGETKPPATQKPLL